MKIIFNEILHIFGYMLKPNKEIKQFLKNMCQDLTTRKLYIYTTNLRGNKEANLLKFSQKIVDVQLQMCVR
jgi:menaquinone-dependent protoporphyrinogen IX oxidase